MTRSSHPPRLHATTILLVRQGGTTCMISDGQVTNGASHTVVKSTASKVKRAGKDGSVLVGFAGGGADALTLFTRFESKLEEFQGNFDRAVIELAMDWRTDRVLRHLEAQMIVANGQKAFLVMGNGDLLEPDDGIVAIGSGGNFALAAARALRTHTELDALALARAAMGIAAELCVYTNDQFTVESVVASEPSP